MSTGCYYESRANTETCQIDKHLSVPEVFLNFSGTDERTYHRYRVGSKHYAGPCGAGPPVVLVYRIEKRRNTATHQRRDDHQEDAKSSR
jgi:hypothetical protein